MLPMALMEAGIHEYPCFVNVVNGNQQPKPEIATLASVWRNIQQDGLPNACPLDLRPLFRFSYFPCTSFARAVCYPGTYSVLLCLLTLQTYQPLVSIVSQFRCAQNNPNHVTVRYERLRRVGA